MTSNVRAAKRDDYFVALNWVLRGSLSCLMIALGSEEKPVNRVGSSEDRKRSGEDMEGDRAAALNVSTEGTSKA